MMQRKPPKRHKVTRRTKSGKTITYWRGHGAGGVGGTVVKGVKGQAGKKVNNSKLYSAFEKGRMYKDEITGVVGLERDVPGNIREGIKKKDLRGLREKRISETGRLPFKPKGKPKQKMTKFKKVGSDKRGNQVFESNVVNKDSKGKYIITGSKYDKKSDSWTKGRKKYI